jgi:hypothetical protein
MTSFSVGDVQQAWMTIEGSSIYPNHQIISAVQHLSASINLCDLKIQIPPSLL